MSMHGQLLIKKQGEKTLDAFVAAIDKIIGPLKWEQRQSSNYVDECYFRASVLALEVVVAKADDAEFGDYDFWLSLSLGVVGATDKSFLDGIADAVARSVCLHGYDAVRPNDMSRTGNGGFVYRLNDDPKSPPRERVVAEPI